MPLDLDPEPLAVGNDEAEVADLRNVDARVKHLVHDAAADREPQPAAPSAQPTRSLALLVQVGRVPGAPGACIAVASSSRGVGPGIEDAHGLRGRPPAVIRRSRAWEGSAACGVASHRFATTSQKRPAGQKRSACRRAGRPRSAPAAPCDQNSRAGRPAPPRPCRPGKRRAFGTPGATRSPPAASGDLRPGGPCVSPKTSVRDSRLYRAAAARAHPPPCEGPRLLGNQRHRHDV